MVSDIAITPTLGENVYMIERNPSQFRYIHFEGVVEGGTRMTIEDIQSAQITNIISLNPENIPYWFRWYWDSSRRPYQRGEVVVVFRSCQEDG